MNLSAPLGVRLPALSLKTIASELAPTGIVLIGIRPSEVSQVVMDLFRSAPIAQPLAARLRATNLDEYVGQEHVLARGKPCLLYTSPSPRDS